MRKLFIIVTLAFLFGCEPKGQKLDNIIIMIEGEYYQIESAGGKLYYIEKVKIMSKN